MHYDYIVNSHGLPLLRATLPFLLHLRFTCVRSAGLLPSLWCCPSLLAFVAHQKNNKNGSGSLSWSRPPSGIRSSLARRAHSALQAMSRASLDMLMCCRIARGAADGLVEVLDSDGHGSSALELPDELPCLLLSRKHASLSPSGRSRAAAASTTGARAAPAKPSPWQGQGTASTAVDETEQPTVGRSDTLKSHLSADTAPGEVSRDRLRDRTRRLRRSMSRPIAQSLRRHLSWHVVGKSVPALESLPKSPPLISDTFPDIELEDIRDAFSAVHDCITYRHLAALGCLDIRGTGWQPCPDNAGHAVRQTLCMIPVPPDAAPPALARLLGVPRAVQATMLQRLCADADEVMLVEQSYTQDVVYLDRCMNQYVRHFSRNVDGGVDMRLWVETIWTRDLPFTHFAVKSFVEKKTSREAADCREDFNRIVQSSAEGCRDSRQQLARVSRGEGREASQEKSLRSPARRTAKLPAQTAAHMRRAFDREVKVPA